MQRPLNQRPFDYIFFDLGDTLIYFDGSPGTIHAACLAMAHYLKIHLEPLFDEDSFVNAFDERLSIYYREREVNFIEDTTEYVLRSMLLEQGYSNIAEELVRNALNEMYAVTEAYWHVEDDAVSTLKTLFESGYHIGLISNAADVQDVQRLVDMAGLRPYLELILISAEVGIRKPHPRIFRLALDHWNASPEQAIMVGDTLGADILGGLNAGISTIWITRRANTKDNNEQKGIIQPDAIVNQLNEIPGLLSQWNMH